MAWRIEESVVRGEIDNRVRGRVTGRIWFAGRAAPIELDLTGNAWRDLAGRRLEFVNPAPSPMPADHAGFATRQTGVIGDCTASRKVKVPEVSMDELMRRYAQRKPFPWHWGNSLYLEWFGQQNGRVVIESATFQLTVSPGIAWDMTLAEEETQRRANAEAMEGFRKRLGEAAADDAKLPEELPEGNEGNEADGHRPQSEAEAERMQEDSERLADRIHARMEREGPDADYEKILDEELERRRRERNEPPRTPEEEAQRAEWLEEISHAAEESFVHPDPGAEAELRQKHPLAERAFKLTVRLLQEPKQHGWLTDDTPEEHPLADLGFSVAKAGAKLAGALNGRDWPAEAEFCAGIIVRLKKARDYLDDARRAAESCGEQKLTPQAWLGAVSAEVTALEHETDGLIAELRKRLEREREND